MTVFIRSVCVGIAAVVFATIGGAFIGMAIAMAFALMRPSPPGAPEVGWDLITMLHNHPGLARDLALAAFLVFVIGFTVGWRAFANPEAERGPTR